MKQNFNITGKIDLDISNAKSSLNSIESSLKKLKLPKSMSTNFSDIFSRLNSSLSDYQERLSKGFRTKGDISGLERTGNTIIHLFKSLDREWDKISNLDLSSIIQLDTKDIQRIDEINEQIQQLNENINKVDPSKLAGISKTLKNIKGSKATKEDIESLVGLGEYEKALKKAEGYINDNRKKSADSVVQYQQIIQYLNAIINEQAQFNAAVNNLEAEKIDIYARATNEVKTQTQQASNAIGNLTQEMNKNHTASVQNASAMAQWRTEVESIKDQATHFFGLANSIDLVKAALRNAYNTVKELDAAMTETAVVTDMTISDLWNELPRYTEEANKLGTTTLGAYETMTLFYQQGLKTNEVFEIGSETMKMARIANLEYTEATDLMTAALRGFNMELNETSAQRVNDVYSELAAITASDTQEIATAMTKTASIANAANMEFETTAAFLTQMIETTRESAENLGTAMKTIVARFTEMKKDPAGIVEVDGEEVDVNKVDAALRSVGVSLKNTNGQFRDLDDVFLELAKKWDTLDLMQQRYVATTAAGSRQQSRFIAMMDNYERTMELVNAANNSAGASNEQFSKTTDSLQSKLNRLSNAWNEFTMGLANNTVVKTGVDILTTILETVNNITGAFGEGVGGVLKFGTALASIKLGKNVVEKGFNFVGTALRGREPEPIQEESKEESKNFFQKAFKAGSKVFNKDTWIRSDKKNT